MPAISNPILNEMSEKHEFDFCKQYLTPHGSFYCQDQDCNAEEPILRNEKHDENQAFVSRKAALRMPAPIFKKFTGLYEGQPIGNYYLLGGFGMRRPMKTQLTTNIARKPN